MPPSPILRALAAFGQGAQQGRVMRDERQERERLIARQTAQDDESRQTGALNRMLAQMQIDERRQAPLLAAERAQQESAARQRRVDALVAHGVSPAEANALADDSAATRSRLEPDKPTYRELSDGSVVSVVGDKATPVTMETPEMQDVPDVPFMAGMGVPQEPTGRRTRVPVRGKVAVSTARNIDPLSPEGIKAREGLLRTQAGLRPPPQLRPKALPGPAVEKLITLDAVLSGTKQARTALAGAVAGNKNVTGRIFGIMPEPNWTRNLRGQGGDTGTDFRALIGDLTSKVGNMRSGGAITPQEFSRLEQFLPTVNDPEHVIAIKLRRFENTLSDIRKTILANYQKYGGVTTIDQAQEAAQEEGLLEY